MLLDPAHTRLELADERTVTDDGGVVFHDRAPQSHNLLAKLLAGRQDIGGDVGA